MIDGEAVSSPLLIAVPLRRNVQSSTRPRYLSTSHMSPLIETRPALGVVHEKPAALSARPFGEFAGSLLCTTTLPIGESSLEFTESATIL